jgi:hypothetical protein
MAAVRAIAANFLKNRLSCLCVCLPWIRIFVGKVVGVPLTYFRVLTNNWT